MKNIILVAGLGLALSACSVTTKNIVQEGNLTLNFAKFSSIYKLGCGLDNPIFEATARGSVKSTLTDVGFSHPTHATAEIMTVKVSKITNTKPVDYLVKKSTADFHTYKAAITMRLDIASDKNKDNSFYQGIGAFESRSETLACDRALSDAMDQLSKKLYGIDPSKY